MDSKPLLVYNNSTVTNKIPTNFNEFSNNASIEATFEAYP